MLEEAGEKDVLEQVKACIEKIKPEEKVDSKRYSERLAFCRECEFLLGGTCLKCGCYVELRAAYKSNKCPLAKSAKKW